VLWFNHAVSLASVAPQTSPGGGPVADQIRPNLGPETRSSARDRGRRCHRAARQPSRALAAGITVFELAKVMGTSVRMIERHYGALLDGAHNVIAHRLDAFEAELEKCSEPAASFASAREAGDGVPN
jgi:hypothetical protein